MGPGREISSGFLCWKGKRRGSIIRSERNRFTRGVKARNNRLAVRFTIGRIFGMGDARDNVRREIKRDSTRKNLELSRDTQPVG